MTFQFLCREAAGEIHIPSSEESEDVVLALLREPGLVSDVEVDLLEVDAQDLRSERGNEVLRKCAILFLHRRRELARVTEAMEKPSKDRICPLLRRPPFRTFTLLRVSRDGISGELEVDDGEEELAPGHQALRRLLMSGKCNSGAGVIRLENIMQHSGDILRRGGDLLSHLCGNGD